MLLTTSTIVKLEFEHYFHQKSKDNISSIIFQGKYFAHTTKLC